MTTSVSSFAFRRDMHRLTCSLNFLIGAMSYCTDPKIVELHGATSGWPFPQVLRPSLALSRAQWNGDIVRIFLSHDTSK